MEAGMRKVAKCMREHGIKVEAGASGTNIKIGPGSPNPESPGFKRGRAPAGSCCLAAASSPRRLANDRRALGALKLAGRA